jgi:hypothetical protein
MSEGDPKTLLEHRASVRGKQGIADPRPLEDSQTTRARPYQVELSILAPVVASAATLECPPFSLCDLPPPTSGGFGFNDNGGAPGKGGWSASGPGYMTSGGGSFDSGGGHCVPYSLREDGAIYMGDDTGNTLNMTLTINGVEWGIPEGIGSASAFMNAGTVSPITHAGTYLASFDLGVEFLRYVGSSLPMHPLSHARPGILVAVVGA